MSSIVCFFLAREKFGAYYHEKTDEGFLWRTLESAVLFTYFRASHNCKYMCNQSSNLFTSQIFFEISWWLMLQRPCTWWKQILGAQISWQTTTRPWRLTLDTLQDAHLKPEIFQGEIFFMFVAVFKTSMYLCFVRRNLFVLHAIQSIQYYCMHTVQQTACVITRSIVVLPGIDQLTVCSWCTKKNK